MATKIHLWKHEQANVPLERIHRDSTSSTSREIRSVDQQICLPTENKDHSLLSVHKPDITDWDQGGS